MYDTAIEYMTALCDLSEKKLEKLRQILSLTQKQSECINEDSIEQLNKLISEKQVIIDDIDRVDLEFEQVFSHFKKHFSLSSLNDSEGIDASQAIRLKNRVADIMQVIKSIQALEMQNNKSTKTLMNDIGEKIKKTKQSRVINNAYNPGMAKSVSYFIDKKK